MKATGNQGSTSFMNHTCRETILTINQTPKDNTLTLPTSRDFIKSHPLTQMANLHNDPTRIAPVWTKVSRTPYNGRAMLCGGYGRRMLNTSLSMDAPKEFLNPERVEIPRSLMDSRTASVIGLRVPKKQEKLDVTYVLPGGEGMKAAATMEIPNRQYRTFPHAGQTFIENMASSRRPRSPINWEPDSNSSRQSTRR